MGVVPGGILADQLTLFQPGGTDYAQLITTGTPGFSDLPTALLKLYDQTNNNNNIMIKQMIIRAFTKDFITKIYFHFAWLYEMLWGKTQTDYGRELLIHINYIYVMRSCYLEW